MCFRSQILPVVRFAMAMGIGVLSCPGQAATTVYVDQGGNDSNPGTYEQPLRSMQALARRTWSPGDAVYFRAGQTFSGILALPGGGSEAAPVMIGSFGQGRATLYSWADTLFSGYNQGGFQFQDLVLKGSPISSSQQDSSVCGLLFYSDSPVGTRYPAITVKNCDFEGFGGPGIKIGSWHPSNPGWSKIRVERCRLWGNGEGMGVYGFDQADSSSARKRYAIDSLEVVHSEFSQNQRCGLSICGVANGWVAFCSFHHNQAVGGCWTWAAKNVLIQNCVSHHNRRGEGNDGFGFDLDGGSIGCTIEHSLSYQNDTAGFAIFDYPNSEETAGNTIRYCVSIDDVRSDREGGSFAMNSWANTPIRNSFIYNCSAFLSTRHGRSICAGFIGIGRQAANGPQSGAIEGCGFWNNVIYVEGESPDVVHLFRQPGAEAASQIAMDGNLYLASSSGKAPRFLLPPDSAPALSCIQQASDLGHQLRIGLPVGGL